MEQAFKDALATIVRLTADRAILLDAVQKALPVVKSLNRERDLQYLYDALKEANRSATKQ